MKKYIKKYIILIILFLSIILNLIIPIIFNKQISLKENQINSINSQIKENILKIENLNNELDNKNNLLKDKFNNENNLKNQIKELQNQNNLLDKKIKNLTISKNKIPNNNVYEVNGNCIDWIKKAGIEEVDLAYKLIMKESGCNVNAINKHSGACGIPQALPCSKLSSFRGDPVKEIIWIKNYVYKRYGSFNNALNFHFKNGWY